jgi:hypothetical protein
VVAAWVVWLGGLTFLLGLTIAARDPDAIGLGMMWFVVYGVWLGSFVRETHTSKVFFKALFGMS